MDYTPLLEQLIEQVKKLPAGTVTSTKQLVDDLLGQPVHFGHDYYYDSEGYEISEEDFAQLGEKLLYQCAYKGITLDATDYYRRVYGLPMDAEYTVLKLV